MTISIPASRARGSVEARLLRFLCRVGNHVPAAEREEPSADCAQERAPDGCLHYRPRRMVLHPATQRKAHRDQQHTAPTFTMVSGLQALAVTHAQTIDGRYDRDQRNRPTRVPFTVRGRNCATFVR